MNGTVDPEPLPEGVALYVDPEPVEPYVDPEPVVPEPVVPIEPEPDMEPDVLPFACCFAQVSHRFWLLNFGVE